MAEATLNTAVAARIDSLCRQFEAALKDGQSPSLDEYVARADTSDHEALRRELEQIRAEYEGISPTPAERHRHLTTPPNAPAQPAGAVATDPCKTTPTPRSPAPHSAGESPAWFAQYQVISFLGEGGFGVVYRGRDHDLDRDVAIKVPRRDRITSAADVQGFLAEARILASLKHPAIVPVYYFGRTDDGQCFVVSQFISGGDLADLIKRKRPSHRESAELLARIADALGHAHQHGLVHRDIKPGNILIDEHGHPLVADFGLALTDDSYGERSGIYGTPAYMSPEQARGEGHIVDARSDIYSLGVVFYELLTGRQPYRRKELRELLGEISGGETRPPRQFDPTIPAELERICLKAMSKHPCDRYTTAFDLAVDLRRFLSGTVEPPVPQPDIPDEKPQAMPLPKPPSRRWVLAVLAAFVGVAAPIPFLLRGKPAPVVVIELKLTISPEKESETVWLIKEGRVADPIPNGALAADETFNLQGRFGAPCYWRMLWLDTRGKWSMSGAQQTAEQDLAYPRDKSGIAIDPHDPPGTHLVLIVASNKPIDEADLLKQIAQQPAPPNFRFYAWAPAAGESVKRGPKEKVETPESYLYRLIERLPHGVKPVGAAFVPVTQSDG